MYHASEDETPGKRIAAPPDSGNPLIGLVVTFIVVCLVVNYYTDDPDKSQAESRKIVQPKKADTIKHNSLLDNYHRSPVAN